MNFCRPRFSKLASSGRKFVRRFRVVPAPENGTDKGKKERKKNKKGKANKPPPFVGQHRFSLSLSQALTLTVERERLSCQRHLAGGANNTQQLSRCACQKLQLGALPHFKSGMFAVLGCVYDLPRSSHRDRENGVAEQ